MHPAIPYSPAAYYLDSAMVPFHFSVLGFFFVVTPGYELPSEDVELGDSDER